VTVTDTSPAGSVKEVAWGSNTTIWPGILSGLMASCRPVTWRAVKSFLKSWATSNKPQATSVKLSHCGSRVHVLKIDLTERYNYEYKRSFKNCGRFK
jgi:hypothetical protein